MTGELVYIWLDWCIASYSKKKQIKAKTQSPVYNIRPNYSSPHTSHRKKKVNDPHASPDLFSPGSWLFRKSPTARVTRNDLEGAKLDRDDHVFKPVRGLTTAKNQKFDDELNRKSGILRHF